MGVFHWQNLPKVAYRPLEVAVVHFYTVRPITGPLWAHTRLSLPFGKSGKVRTRPTTALKYNKKRQKTPKKWLSISLKVKILLKNNKSCAEVN